MRPKPKQKLLFKIYKPVAEFKFDEAERALRKAMDNERKQQLGGESKDGDQEHLHDGDCCKSSEK